MITNMPSQDFAHPNIIIQSGFTILERGLSIPNPEWLIPDKVVEWCARQWGLLEPDSLGIDPFAGTATIPDVINRIGGTCDANEFDALYCSIAEARLPEGSLLRHGDYASIRTPGFYRGYDYVYTSPPFAYFIGDMLDQGQLASYLYAMLGKNGKLIIDSAATAVRNDITLNPAIHTVRYLHDHGFHLEDWISFTTLSNDKCDSQFTELLFTKR